jgi:hypothetical protein
MLVEFKVGNYRSFRDEQTLSLVASSDKHLLKNTTVKRKLRLLKGAAIYGPNASGKSNLIRAADTMREMVLKSANYAPGQELPIQPFVLDKSTREQPSLFEMTFFENNVRYQYGFEASATRIVSEWLLAYPKGYAQTWFERTPKGKRKGSNWKFGSHLAGDKHDLARKTRENALFLSVAAQWNHRQLSPVQSWFESKLFVKLATRDWGATTERILHSLGTDPVAKPLAEKIVDILRWADLGISDLKVEKTKYDAEKVKRYLSLFPAGLREEVATLMAGALGQSYDVRVMHRSKAPEDRVALKMDDESEGTRRFFEMIGPWLWAIVENQTLFVDEIESSLHAMLTRFLVQFLLESEARGDSPQLIFATHDTTLLDPELFRRDQIWFTEKDENGATKLYSMWDYKECKPRKGEAMQKGYLAGRYGAIPVIEAFDLKQK